MHRNDVIAKLRSYEPSNKTEIGFKQQMLAFISRHENCFERSLSRGHVTASSWLINKTGDRALLLHHMKLDRWFQLGGHCDGDPDVLRVALKEAREESGIEHIEPVDSSIFDIDIHTIPESNFEQEHLHYDLRFLLQVKSDEDLCSNRESKELRWIGKDIKELPTDNPSVVRMFKKWVWL